MAQRSICPYFITGCHIFNNFVLFDALWAAAQRLVSLFAVDTCRPFFLLNIFIWTSSELPWVIDDARPVRHTDWLEPFFPALSIFPPIVISQLHWSDWGFKCPYCHLILFISPHLFTRLIQLRQKRGFLQHWHITQKSSQESILLEMFVKLCSPQAGFYFLFEF